MIFTHEYMSPLFDFLERCQGVRQDPATHPEGDVFIHSLQVVRWAFRETVDTDLIIAAMVHDIGKLEISYGHEFVSASVIEPYVSGKTLWLVENHMRGKFYMSGKMKKLSKCSTFAQHPWLPELVQLCRWDKMGRQPGINPRYDRDQIIDRLNKAAKHYFRGRYEYARKIHRYNNRFGQVGVDGCSG